jgi:hypothetical protein
MDRSVIKRTEQSFKPHSTLPPEYQRIKDWLIELGEQNK